mmetsp:Transcript_91732/g.294879  ORF Transcript_91732/g.294879 Transcript_91732/m.294879 type:complete len:271 (+) Transcript_91732:46-858(+)
MSVCADFAFSLSLSIALPLSSALCLVMRALGLYALVCVLLVLSHLSSTFLRPLGGTCEWLPLTQRCRRSTKGLRHLCTAVQTGSTSRDDDSAGQGFGGGDGPGVGFGGEGAVDREMLKELRGFFTQRLCREIAEVLSSTGRVFKHSDSGEVQAFVYDEESFDGPITVTIRIDTLDPHSTYVIMKSVFAPPWTSLAESMVFANRWNSQKKHSKMYVDHDGDLVLLMDMEPAIHKKLSDSLPWLLHVMRISARTVTLEALQEYSLADNSSEI